MAQATKATLELRLGAHAEGDLAVTRLTGREELSAPYAFDVEFHARGGESLELADLLGAEALVTLRGAGGAERLVHAVAWSVELAGLGAGRAWYRARLVPAVRRLEHVRRSRVFQSLSLPEIVEKVLKEGGVEHRIDLAGSHARREMVLQYRESDLAFVSRLLEEEGIFWFFEHSAEGHVLVLADAPDRFVPVAGDAELRYRVTARAGSVDDDEHVEALEVARRVRSGKVLLQDYDFLRPALTLQGVAQAGGAPAGLERAEYPGGFGQPAAGTRLAKIRLEDVRRPAATVAGRTNCVRLLPGAAFEVVEHPDAAMNQKLHVVAVRHEAEQARGAGGSAGSHDYRCSFEALEASLPVRPSRRTPRPSARLETATVVGPGGEEIHPDAHGRVKVRFHWDREGPKDDKASCWIRLSQAWAGVGWGASFVPRVGQEVLVRFLEGDPDRPLVVGAVYNGPAPPPIPLPDDKTRSTLRTESSIGGGGFNELRFEDLAGSEEIFLRAQKDEDIEVRNDKAQRVGASETLEVDENRALLVKGNQELDLTGSDAGTVSGNQTRTVAAERRTSVGGDHAETVARAAAVAVGGARAVTAGLAGAETVGAAAALTVGAAYAVTVGGVHNTAVGGLLGRQVAGARVEVIGARREERVGKDSTCTVGGDLAQEVKEQAARNTAGDHQEQVDGEVGAEVVKGVEWKAQELTLEAESKVTVVVGGKAVLTVDSSGNVKLGAGKLLVEGNTLTLKGSKVELGGSGSAASASASVAKLKPAKGDKAFVEISMKDQDGNPLPNELFKVEFPDGTVKEGRTGGSGKAWVPGAKEGKVKLGFPALDQKSLK